MVELVWPTWKMANPRARCKTALGMAFKADSGCSGLAVGYRINQLADHTMRADSSTNARVTLSYLGTRNYVNYSPRKLSSILAAFSASPGSENPRIRVADSCWTRDPPSCIKAVAWSWALRAPARNLSSIVCLDWEASVGLSREIQVVEQSVVVAGMTRSETVSRAIHVIVD